MRLFCIECGKPVSNELPEETIVRAICICPECIAKQPIQRKKYRGLSVSKIIVDDPLLQAAEKVGKRNAK